MTCIERLTVEHPEELNDHAPGGADCCPHHYGYAEQPCSCFGSGSNWQCKKCWNRKVSN